MGEASGEPVGRVMSDWTRVQGWPTVGAALGQGIVTLTQTSASPASRGQLWLVPLGLQVRGREGEVVEERRILLEETEMEVELEVPPHHALVLNCGQTSFCRVRYCAALQARLWPLVGRLPARERLGVLGDLAALALGGGEGLGALVGALGHYRGEVEWPVVQVVLGALARLEELVEGTKRWAPFLQLAYSVLRPSLHVLGWEAVEGEGAGAVLARGALVGRLARLGCTETVGRCWMLWRGERAGRGAVAPDLRLAVYGAVARAGGHEEVAALVELYNQAETAEVRRMLGAALAQSSRQEEVLEWAVGEQVRSQDRVFVIAGVAAAGAEGRSAAWAAFRRHSAGLLRQYTSGQLLKVLVGGVTRHGGSREEAEEFTRWFEEQGVEGVGRTLLQAREEVEARAGNRARVEEEAGSLLPSC